MSSIIENISTSQALLRNANSASGSLFKITAPAPVESRTDDERISEFNLTTDSLNLILAEVGCPVEMRPLIDALIGVAGTRIDDWFEVSDAVIAQRMEKSEKTVARRRNDLTAWQTENHITFIEIQDEYTDNTGKRHSHAYRVHLPRMAVETMDEAKTDTLQWRRNPGIAMQTSAKRKRDDFPDMPARTHRGRKSRPDAEIIINKNLKHAETLLRKAEELVNGIELKRHIYGNHEMFMLNPDLLSSIRKSLDALSERASSGDDDDELVHQPYYKKLVDTAAEEAGDRVSSDGSGGQNVHMDDARQAIEAFVSVGVNNFDVTMLDEHTKECGSDKGLCTQVIIENLESYLKLNTDTMTSFIIRPRGGALIQIDDLSASALERIRDLAFLIAETSEGNFQAWIVLTEGTNEETRQSIRRRLLSGLGVDKNASGAMRWPGSINRKPERNGFRVRLDFVRRNRTVFVTELEAANLLTPEQTIPVALTTPIYKKYSHQVYPNYDDCLTSKNGNRSDADASFLRKAVRRGFALEEAWSELERVALRSKLRRQDYKRRTLAYAVKGIG